MEKHLYILVYSAFVLIVLAFFVPTGILMQPLVTPMEYLGSIPYKELSLFGFNFILIKPSSTFFVYLLGLITVLIGMMFLKGSKLSRKHWGTSIVLWGLGALLAGTSYQGLGYELKCVGQELCMFTSWWELSYLYVTGLSISLMMFAMLMEVFGRTYKYLWYPIFGFVFYSVLLTLGSIFEVYFLITYEMFILFFGIYFVTMFVINVKEYLRTESKYHMKMIQIWLILLLVNILYFVYLLLGIGETLMDKFGIWFSANDVLHIALIAWMFLIWFNLKDEMKI